MAEASHPAFALFLDFDGTLVDIAERPEAVVVDPALPAVLARLRDGLGGALALVSGRPIATLDGFLAPERFDAAGIHGVERRIGGRYVEDGSPDHSHLQTVMEALRCFARAQDGILLEDKGASFALHWRLRPELADDALTIIHEAAAALGPGYRIQHGKAVAEVLPAQAGKGAAMAWFLEKPPFSGCRPVFIGDDLTDEHGFVTVNQQGGVSIRIGPGPTVARLRLPSPAALRSLLAEWAEAGRIALDAAVPAAEGGSPAPP